MNQNLKPNACKNRPPDKCCMHILILQTMIFVPQPSLAPTSVISALQSSLPPVRSREERRMFSLCINEAQEGWRLPDSVHAMGLGSISALFTTSSILPLCLKTNDTRRIKPTFCEEQFSIQSALHLMSLRLGTSTSLVQTILLL